MTDIAKILNDPDFLKSLQGRQYLLDNYAQPKERRKKKGPGRPIWEIPAAECKYSLYEKLHELWCEYMDELLHSNYSAVNIQEKLLRADFHGAKIKVHKSTCSSYEDLSGIVIHDTQRTFRVIGQDDKVRTLLKQNSIFEILIQGKTVLLFGEHFQYRPKDRIKAKWTRRDKLKLISGV